MTGQILDYSIQTNIGAISGDDGNRYTFTGADWRESGIPQAGMRVDFDNNGNAAIEIYSEVPTSAAALGGPVPPGGQDFGSAIPQEMRVVAPPGTKSKVTAGVLAIVFGNLGIHKFYLGYIGIGILHNVVFFLLFFTSCTVGCVVGFVTFGVGFLLPLVVILTYQLVPIVEGIIYLTKSEEDFHQTYVVNSRSFF